MQQHDRAMREHRRRQQPQRGSIARHSNSAATAPASTGVCNVMAKSTATMSPTKAIVMVKK